MGERTIVFAEISKLARIVLGLRFLSILREDYESLCQRAVLKLSSVEPSGKTSNVGKY